MLSRVLRMSVNYSQATCVHTDRYGIQNLCYGRSTCTFNVTNSNVGSSCGAKGTAFLQIEFICIRNGGWSEWSSGSPCSMMCGSGIQTFKRNCTNPPPNEYGEQCTGKSSTEDTCNNHNCFYEGKSCKDQLVSFTCSGGYLQVNSATWKTSTLCSLSFISYKLHDVTTRIQNKCNNRANCNFTAEDTSMGVSCSEPAARCSRFEYVYTCVTPTWNAWMIWSTCSKSCGIGIQKRTRSCMNDFNTTDGFINDCEGASEEERQCQAVNCSYCGDYVFNDSYQVFSDADLSSGTGFMLTDQVNAVNCCGRVKQWHIVSTKAGSIRVIIWRRAGKNTYKVIGTNSLTVQASDVGKQRTYHLTDRQMIAINKGDVVGWDDGGNNIIGYTICDKSSDICPKILLRNSQANIKDGDEIEITSMDHQLINNRTYAISYTSTNNRPPVVSTITDTVTIGDHSLPDSFVMRMQLTDPDYGDFIRVIGLDYDNVYFYFDTKLWSIYVKKDLPHTTGIKQVTHIYTLSAEDSCYNAVTINATIVTENEPPSIKGLHHLLQINTVYERTNITSFRVVDPSDNVSCHISYTSPLTDMFVLSLSGNDASLYLSDNASIDTYSSSQFSIHISCTDGTDNTTFQLIVQFTTDQETTIPEKSDSRLVPIITASVSVVCFVILMSCIYTWRQKMSASKSSIRVEYELYNHDQSSNHQYDSMIMDGTDISQGTEEGNAYVNISSTGQNGTSVDDNLEPQNMNSVFHVYNNDWR